jgi:voltage-gated potassium channel Kch
MMVEKQKEVRSYLAKFWSKEWKLTWLFWAVMFDTTLVYPLVSIVGSGVAIRIMNDVSISVIFVSGLFALTRRLTTRTVFGGIIIIVIANRLMRFLFGVNLLVGWDTLLSLIIVVAFVTFILRYVFKEGRVTWQRVEGAVTAYMLIAVAFSLAYLLIFSLIPGAFKFSDGAPSPGDPRSGYIFHYFSVVTLTTLGYGDIMPVHPFARTLTMIEAYVGQLYPAILLARLVSLYVLHSHRLDK